VGGLGPPGAVSKLYWVASRAARKPPGFVWSALFSFWGALGRSWSAQGTSWSALGTSWGAPGAHLEHFGHLLGTSRGALGALLGRSGRLLEGCWSQDGPKEAPSPKMLVFHWFCKVLAAQTTERAEATEEEGGGG
jgi:hypothetical protein